MSEIIEIELIILIMKIIYELRLLSLDTYVINVKSLSQWLSRWQ